MICDTPCFFDRFLGCVGIYSVFTTSSESLNIVTSLHSLSPSILFECLEYGTMASGYADTIEMLLESLR